jgi:hypothetical protein
MNKITYKKPIQRLSIFGTALLLAAAASCTDLDVDIKSEYTESNFPITNEEFIAATGQMYTQLRGEIAGSYHMLQEWSTDDGIVVARAGNWFDGARFVELHKHTWTPDHPISNTIWTWGYSMVSTSNRLMTMLQDTPDSPSKSQFISEIRTMRALAYFFLLDTYGNVPIVTVFGEEEMPTNSSRDEVFDFIVTELEESMEFLSPEVNSATYGRPTQWMAQAILAKLYLNAFHYLSSDHSYNGTAMFDEAIAACNAIIASGKYSLVSDYLSIFKPDNGPEISEIIFASPMDAQLAQGLMHQRYELLPQHRDKYGLDFNPSNASSSQKGYYEYFDQENDQRNAIWLTGKQFDSQGNPIMVSTTRSGFDDKYNGPNPNEVIEIQVELTPDIILENEAIFDKGNDLESQWQGYKIVKYHPDADDFNRFQNNDYVLFRYADILLMKAEAILRGGTDPNGQTAEALVNEVYARATGKGNHYASIDLDALFRERTREMAREGWRRNDLIRFGKWEDSWTFKTDSDPTRRIFPIPATELNINPNLVQNEGY